MLDLEQAKQELAKAPARDPSSRAERLRLLLLHSKEFYRQNPKQAEKWAREALALATKLKDEEGIARAYYTIGATAFQQAHYPFAEASFTKAIELDQKERFTTPLFEGPMLGLGLVYAQQGKFREALDLYEQALKLCRQEKRPSEVSILTAMGNASIELADYPAALKYLYNALAVLDEHDDPLQRSVIFTSVGLSYLHVQDLTKANDFFTRASILSESQNDLDNLSNTLYDLAIIAAKKGDNETSRILFARALSTAKRIERIDTEAFVLNSFGHLSLNAGKHLEAERYFKKALELAKTLELKTVWCGSLVGLGRTSLALNKPANAIQPLQEAMELARGSGMASLECDALEVLAQAYEGAGKLKDAVLTFHRFILLNSEVHGQERQRAIAEVQARVEIEKADRERARIEAIAKDATERAELLRKESERQSQELTTLALQLVEKNEFLCDLKEEIEPNFKSSRKAKEIGRRIDDHIRSDRDWETFENQFQHVHGGFVRHLSIRFPGLTPTELKIAVLIRLNLPTKSIASLLCLSTRTVENHRQRLRKKLHLEPDASLVTFLAGLGDTE